MGHLEVKNMRYENAEDIIRLIMLMQNSSQGLSIQDIQDEFNISRRTAERMKEAVVRLIPQTQKLGERIKRWCIPANCFSPLRIGSL